ncbi:MAG: glycosyltransferase family 39 protein [Anaerolineae bacterium]
MSPIMIVTAITALAFGLRLISLNHGDLSFDEAASALIARKSLAEMIPYLLRAIHEHPPGYYVLVSGWIRLVGDGEMMLRFFSVMMGTLSIPLLYRWAREAVSVTGGIVAALILSVTPLHVFYSQNARMYPMVGVLALLSWWLLLRLQRSDRLKDWIGLSVCGLIGLVTHYYMALVIASQGVYLLLTWKQNKRLLGKWMIWLGIPIALGAIYISASPGALATLVTSFAGGIGSALSAKALRSLAADLIFGPHGNLGIDVWSVILLIVLGGIALAISGRAGVKRPFGWMLLCALFVPLGLVVVLPEAIAARYVLFLIFPIVLALTVVIVSPLALRPRSADSYASIYAPRGLRGTAAVASRASSHTPQAAVPGGVVRAEACPERSRRDGAPSERWVITNDSVVSGVSRAMAALAAFALIALNVSRLPYHYAALKGDYGRLMAQVQALYQPGDGVIFNGPWQAILQTYYPIGDVPFVYLPPQTPPALDPLATGPQLAEFLRAHRRVWVIPLEVDIADPDRFVARWLDAHAYQALEQPNLALYYAPPPDNLPVLSAPMQFGEGVELVSAQIATRMVPTGAAAIVALEWRTLQPIDGDVQVGLEIVDQAGSVWGRRWYRPGQRYAAAEEWNSGSTIMDRQAIPIDLGAPPGEYSLRITVQRASTGETLLTADRSDPLYTALTSLQVQAASAAIPDARLPGTPVGVRFGEGLSLAAYQLPSNQFVQGGAIPVKLYWRALDGDRAVSVDVALVDSDGNPIDVSSGPLGPAWYPAAEWRTGEVVATSTALRVPPRLTPGRFRLQVTVHDQAGRPLVAQGMIDRSGFLGLWTDRIATSLDTWQLAEVAVAARERNFAAPVVQHPLTIAFGDQIELLGYDLDSANTRVGGQLRITFYWKALKSIDRDYVVFTHLRDASGQLRGQRDGMPLGGSNPTSFWQAGEVVADTYAIAIDPAAPPGDYTLGFGWYESDSSLRLPALSVDGARYRDDVAVIPDLSIAPSASSMIGRP